MTFFYKKISDGNYSTQNVKSIPSKNDDLSDTNLFVRRYTSVLSND